MIRPVTLADVQAICDLYNYYVEHTAVTFEEDLISLDEMADRIKTISSKFPYIVYEEDGQVVGFAYGNTWRVRKAYRFSCETSIYLKHDHQGRGLGEQLYVELISLLKAQGMHLIVGGLTLPNDRSVRLHEKLGFLPAGRFKEAGWKFNQWRDVGFWQLNVETEVK